MQQIDTICQKFLSISHINTSYKEIIKTSLENENMSAYTCKTSFQCEILIFVDEYKNEGKEIQYS